MSSDERKIAEWSDKPYTSVRKRHYTVRHRVKVAWHRGVGCDVTHEIKCERRDIDDWTLAEAWEFRDHGIEKVTTDVGRGLP